VLVAVALLSRWTTVVANGGSSSSLLYFSASSSSIFHLFCQQYSSLSMVVSGSAAGDGQEEEWRDGQWFQTAKREVGERGYCSYLYYLFFHPLYSILFPFLLSPAPIFHSLFPWFCWRLLPVLLVVVERKKQRWCPGGEDDSSSSLCRDCSLCFSLPTSVFAFSFFLFLQLTSLFSPKKILSPLLLFPCIYRQPGERFTIPYASAGHGGVGWLLYSHCRAWPSSSFVVVAGYGGYG
jgi:hypothetical protein